MSARTVKLAKKGMIAWEVDGVLARLTKKQSADPDLSARFGPWVRFAGLVGLHLRTRVRDRSTFINGERWRGYSPFSTVLMTDDYARLAGVRQVFFRSSRRFHFRANPNELFSPTGGMWAGLTARARGSSSSARAELVFDSTSAGRGETVPSEDAAGRRILLVKNKSVRNWMKAGAVFLGTGHNIIQNDNPELLAMGGVLANRAAAAAGEVIPGFEDAVVRFAGRNSELELLLERNWR